VSLFFYHFAWTVIIILSLPLIPRLKKRRFFERAGFGLPPDRLKKSIWIHALSVGEVVSAIPLVRSLNRKYPRKDIVFTVTTPQGMKIACKELEGAVKVLLPMPLDFWWSVQRVVNYINPSFFILIETDLWPGLISYLKRRGIKTVLINGRISPRTFRSYKRFRFFIRIMFNSLELCLMQSDLDKKRLLQIGIGPDRVKVAGNIKFDHDWSPMVKNDYEHWLNILALKHEDDIWVAGSTHQGEEEVILDVFKRLRLSFPLLRLIIAPRRIERAGDTCRLSLNKGLKTVLKTELTKYREPYDVLILDTIGELRKIYGVGKISFVGGSLVPIGGHNLLEPATFGLPVLFGPHTDNFVLMSQLLIETGGGRRVKDEEDLFETIKELLSDPERSKRMGGKAREFVAMNRGALGRVMDLLEIYL